MKKIRFTGWAKNLSKIKFILILHGQAGLSLKESKDIEDRIADGEEIEILVPQDKIDKLLSESAKFGVHGEGSTRYLL